MLALARGKASQAGLAIDFRLADAAELPFAAASFDPVIERHLLWTLPDPAGSLAEWARVLRPGGRLILIEVQNRRLRADHAPLNSALPLVDNTAAAEIAPLVEVTGLADLFVEPLTNDVLWGGRLPRERYALLARKPR
jgi:ubiquinone/menaquinone biosynthesis C-methylase UbiE